MEGKTQHMNPNPTWKLLGKLPNSNAGICHPGNRAICLQCLISQQRLTSQCSNPTHSPLNMSEQNSVRSGIVFGLFLKHRRDGLCGGRSWGCPSLSASPRSLGEASPENNKKKNPTTKHNQRPKHHGISVRDETSAFLSSRRFEWHGEESAYVKGRGRHCWGPLIPAVTPEPPRTARAGDGSGAAARPHPHFSTKHNRPQLLDVTDGETAPAAKMGALGRDFPEYLRVFCSVNQMFETRPPKPDPAQKEQ